MSKVRGYTRHRRKYIFLWYVSALLQLSCGHNIWYFCCVVIIVIGVVVVIFAVVVIVAITIAAAAAFSLLSSLLLVLSLFIVALHYSIPFFIIMVTV